MLPCYNQRSLAVKLERYQAATSRTAPMVKLVDTADLKSAAFVNNGRAGSIPARGTIE